MFTFVLIIGVAAPALATIIPTPTPGFTETFEHAGAIPAGWSFTGSFGIKSTGTGNHTPGGTYSAGVTAGASGSTHTIISDVVDYTGKSSAHLSFWYRCTATAAASTVKVDASIDNGVSYTVSVVPVFTVLADSAFHLISDTGDLSSLAGKSSVKFRWTYVRTAGYINIDDITFTATAAGTAPTVTTGAATSVEETTATLNGTVTSDGGATITERGFYCDTSASPTTKYVVSGTTGAYTKDMTSLSLGTRYYFKAFATNSVGTSYGSILNFRTKPNPPSSFTATAVSYNEIDLTWTKGTGAWKTKILQKAGSAPTSRTDGTVIYDDTGSSYNKTGLDPSITYYYQAWSYTDSPEQLSDSPDATAYATTLAAATATATGPTGSTDNASVTLTYNYTGSPTSVKLYYTKDAGTTWTLAGEDTSVDGTFAYNITSGDGTYGWIAVAIGGGSTETDPPAGGTTPEAASLILDATAPPTPSLVLPENCRDILDNTPTFEWTSVTDPSGVTYQIQIDNGIDLIPPDFIFPVYDVAGITENTYTLPDENALELCVHYWWRVRAKDNVGNIGDWSVTWNFTVVPVGAIGVLLMPLLMLLPFALMLRRQNKRYRY
jgi:hypothetical protein